MPIPSPRWTLLLLPAWLTALGATPAAQADPRPTWPVPDTGQVTCYDSLVPIDCRPDRFGGQDGAYQGQEPGYQDHGDGTVTDLVTGLMWQQDPGPKRTWAAAADGAKHFALAGYDDWRLPSIHELYSLIRFDGTDPSGCRGDCAPTPFLDPDFFEFSYGDPQDGERLIDAQFASRTRYVGTTMGGQQTAFGVNFADGRIKGYPVGPSPRFADGKPFAVLYVRGEAGIGLHDFEDLGDGTVVDHATGLTWAQADSGGLSEDGLLSWAEALAWAEGLELGGHSDWRLPNAKELQTLVDYGRSPATTRSPALDPVFDASTIRDEGGGQGYGAYWTSTTHASDDGRGANAVTVHFGEALGWMPDRRTGQRRLMDVHGAGAQRSDPKAGSASRFPTGRGPQGDVVRTQNLVRVVRGGEVIRVQSIAPPMVLRARENPRRSMSPDGPGERGSERAQRPPRQPSEDERQQRPPRREGGRQDGPGRESESGRRGPPPEAIAACDGASRGDPCSFEGRRGERVEGLCDAPRDELACVPERGPR